MKLEPEENNFVVSEISNPQKYFRGEIINKELQPIGIRSRKPGHNDSSRSGKRKEKQEKRRLLPKNNGCIFCLKEFPEKVSLNFHTVRL